MKKNLLVLLCFSVLTTSTLTAQNLGPCSSDDSRTSTAAPNPKKNPPKRNHSRREHIAESFGEFLLEIFVDLVVVIAVETNEHVLFDDFPYANSDFFIQYDDINDDFENSDDIDSTKIKNITYDNLSRYDIGVNMTYLPDSVTFVPNFRFDGYFYKFFGPVVEASNFINFNHYTPFFGNVKLGFEISTFQSFIFNWSWNFDWVAYYGEEFTQGANLGFIIKSYPFEPLVLEYRLNYSILDNYFGDTSWAYLDPTYAVESYLEIGVMIDNSPLEAYVGWKYLYDGPAQIDDHGFTVGAKYHF